MVKFSMSKGSQKKMEQEGPSAAADQESSAQDVAKLVDSIQGAEAAVNHINLPENEPAKIVIEKLPNKKTPH